MCSIGLYGEEVYFAFSKRPFGKLCITFFVNYFPIYTKAFEMIDYICVYLN